MSAVALRMLKQVGGGARDTSADSGSNSDSDSGNSTGGRRRKAKSSDGGGRSGSARRRPGSSTLTSAERRNAIAGERGAWWVSASRRFLLFAHLAVLVFQVGFVLLPAVANITDRPYTTLTDGWPNTFTAGGVLAMAMMLVVLLGDARYGLVRSMLDDNTSRGHLVSALACNKVMAWVTFAIRTSAVSRGMVSDDGLRIVLPDNMTAGDGPDADDVAATTGCLQTAWAALIVGAIAHVSIALTHGLNALLVRCRQRAMARDVLEIDNAATTNATAARWR